MESAYKECLEEVSRAARTAGWVVGTRRDGEVTWRSFDRSDASLPEQGWKLHASFAAHEAVTFVRRVVSELIAQNVSFKVADDISTIQGLNDGKAGPTQVGKCLTLYPENDDQCRAAGKLVLALWPVSNGPRLVSDLLVTSRGHVGLRYGAFAGGRTIMDPPGRVKHAIAMPDGTLVEDVRAKDGSQPDWAPPPPVAVVRSPDLADPISAGEAAFAPVAVVQSVAKGDVRMVMRTEEPFELAFAKSARSGIVFTQNGHTATDLLRREYEVQGYLHGQAFPCPKPLAFSEQEDGVVAVSLDLGGEALSMVRAAGAQRYVPELLRLVARLHCLGYVHRDLKPANVLVTDEGLALIDFELTSRIGENNAPAAGTDGFCGNDRADSSLRRDYCGLRGIIIWAWLGANPANVTDSDGLLRLHGLHEVASWLESLAEADGVLDLEALALRIDAFLAAPEIREPDLAPASLSPTRILEGTKHHLRAFADTPMNGACRWRNVRNEGDTFSEGIYRGTAGVVLALMTLEELADGDCAASVADGCGWLASRDLHEVSAGFFTGNAGVAVVLDTAAQRYANLEWRAAADRYYEAALRAPLLEADLYFGASGVLWAATLRDAIYGGKRNSLAAHPIVDWLRSELVCDGEVWHWPNNGTLDSKGLPYLGAAHGVAGTAMALGAWARTVGDDAVQRLHDELFLNLFEKTRTPDGKQLLANVGADNEFNPPHVWCHGVGGYLWALLQCPEPSGALREAIAWSVDRLVETPAVGNATYCHGLSGRLEVLSMASRLRDVQQAAAVTVTALEKLNLESTGPCVWPCEDGKLVSPELWTGFLSPATALAMHASGIRDGLLSRNWLTRLARGGE